MVRVNLLPESIQVSQTRRRHAARWGAAITISAVAAAIPLVAHWSQHHRIDELRVTSEELQANLNAARTELKSVSSQASDLVLRSERAKALREKRSWSAMVALIASCLPKECWLTSLATDPATPATAAPARKLPAAAPPVPAIPASAQAEKPVPVTIDAPRKLRVVGNAGDPTQPLAFVAKLKESRVFREVTLERAHREGDEAASLFRFEVLCEW